MVFPCSAASSLRTPLPTRPITHCRHRSTSALVRACSSPPHTLSASPSTRPRALKAFSIRLILASVVRCRPLTPATALFSAITGNCLFENSPEPLASCSTAGPFLVLLPSRQGSPFAYRLWQIGRASYRERV